MLDRYLPKIGFVLALAATATALLVAKDNPSTPPQMITLNLAAVDSHGQPVQDLRAEDIQVIDNGKPQPVVWLRSLSAKTPEPRATFILIDLFNADLQSAGLSENEVVEALEKVHSDANIYLYLLTSAATIFPVHGVAASSDPQWTQHVKASLDDAIRQTNGLKAGNQLSRLQRIGPTWNALSNLAGQLAQVPGPKSFIWVTQGIQNGLVPPGQGPEQFVHIVSPVRDFSDKLNALGTAIYTVQQKPSGSLAVESTGTPGDTLKQLSELTGGQSFPTDSTSQAITQAMSEVRQVNYRLGFLPQKVDGKYHKIQLTSTRSGVKIQTAVRYYGSGADIERNLPTRNSRPMLAGLLNEIARSPFDYPEIGVRATMSGSTLTIHLDGHDALFLKDGPRYKAELSVDIAESGANGPMKSTGPVVVNLDMSEDEHAKALTAGIDIPRSLVLDGATRQVRVAVLDHTSYLAGTSTIPAAHK